MYQPPKIVKPPEPVFERYATAVLKHMLHLMLVLIVMAIPAVAAAGSESLKSDRVVIKKNQRRLLLMKEARILYSFKIFLGDEPEGDKLEEGDWRTPEGRYIIDWRNAHSRFYKSMHISYPSLRDLKESAAAGVEPGGMIMIHGHPPEAQTEPAKYTDRDWTNGGIALQNKDMDIVWSLVDDGTPVDILP